MKIRFWFIICFIFSLGCNKSPGEGGRTTISGTVYNDIVNPYGDIVAREQAIDEDIFIVYGTEGYFDDEIKTNEAGLYEFKFLQKGEYKIFGYSDCSACDSDLTQQEITVSSTGKNETTTATDLVLLKSKDYNDGHQSVSGKLKVLKYNDSGVLTGEFLGADKDIFIVYEKDSVPFDDQKTGPNGEFRFSNLLPGMYTVYAFSDCLNCIAGVEEKSVSVDLTGTNTDVDAGNIEVDDRP